MYYIYDYSQNVGMGSMSFSDSEGQSTIYGPNGSGWFSYNQKYDFEIMIS